MLLLVEAGFSMEDTLRIATLNGAQALKVEEAFGSITARQKADIVIFLIKIHLKITRIYCPTKQLSKGEKVYKRDNMWCVTPASTAQRPCLTK